MKKTIVLIMAVILLAMSTGWCSASAEAADDPGRQALVDAVRQKIGAGGAAAPLPAESKADSFSDAVRAGREKAGIFQTTPPSAPPITAPVSKEDQQAALNEIRRLMERQKYYDAALAIDACRSDYPGTRNTCQELWDELADALKANRPATGSLERTIQYEGRNELRIHAESGDVVVNARDVNNGQYVRYYIRQGDSAVIYFPGGEYSFSVETGELWFDNVTGFGAFGETINADKNLIFNYKDDGNWATYTWYEYTI
jgi:hypothetical protein